MSKRRSLGLVPLVSVGLFLVLALSGCKKDKSSSTTCTIGDPSSCSSGLVCEEVQGGDPTCFAPVVVRGQVFDATTDAGIAGASVVALDANGAAVTVTATTDASGNYSLTVPAMRDATGAVLAASVTLRVDASGYVSFPTPPRFALPIDLTAAVSMGGQLVVDSSVTDVSLFGIPAQIPAVTYGTIRGTISGADAAGALVVAEQGAPAKAVSTAIVGTDGTFVLYNVPINVATNVTAYAAGVTVTSATATVTSAGTSVDVALTADTTGLGTVSGSVNIVNPGNGSLTSVLLVVESTFDDVTKRGQVPVGLRAGNVSNAFTIANVPAGKYVVLAAFENDFLVRDPDTTIGGTQIVHITVTAGGTITLSTSFKVTGALDHPVPGTTGLEVVTTPVTQFQWDDDSSEDGYEFRLYDAYGNEVVTARNLDVPKHTGGQTVTYTPASAITYTPGMVYQFRVLSFGCIMGNAFPCPSNRKYLSATEDLLGVFQYQP